MSQKLHNSLLETLTSATFFQTIGDATNCGAFDGGCLIVAKALRLLFVDSELIRLCSERGIDRTTQTEHYGIALPDGRVIDGSGIATDSDAWIERFSREESIPFALSTEDGYDEEAGFLEDPRTEMAIFNLLFCALGQVGLRAR